MNSPRRRLQTALLSGAEASLSRRLGRLTPQVEVVGYFGENDDTPVSQLLREARPRTQSFRDGHLHVSDVIGKCIRKIALLRRLNVPHPIETLPDGKGITFAIGEALHDYVKQRMIEGHPNKVWADWACPCGKTVERGIYAEVATTRCPDCGLLADRHREVSFLDPNYGLSGSPDLILWLPEYRAYYITEIKSISAKAFADLARPLPDHPIQAAFYWYLMRALGYPLVDRVSILYVNKEFSFKFPYKEFMIEPNVDTRLAVYFQDLNDLALANQGGPLPPRTTCGTLDAPDAKQCPVRVSCFGCES